MSKSFRPHVKVYKYTCKNNWSHYFLVCPSCNNMMDAFFDSKNRDFNELVPRQFIYDIEDTDEISFSNLFSYNEQGKPNTPRCEGKDLAKEHFKNVKIKKSLMYEYYLNMHHFIYYKFCCEIQNNKNV